MPDHAAQFFEAVKRISTEIDTAAIDRLARELAALRERRGRLFLLGVGGSAGNCSHAVNDFRKLCAIEAYSPVDNVSELTARTNDEGWDTVFTGWLEVSRLSDNDALMIFSVGGGDAERNVSVNLVRAVDLARQRGAKVFGIVGRASGHTARYGCRHPHSAGRPATGDPLIRGNAGRGLALPGFAPDTADPQNDLVSGF